MISSVTRVRSATIAAGAQPYISPVDTTKTAASETKPPGRLSIGTGYASASVAAARSSAMPASIPPDGRSTTSIVRAAATVAAPAAITGASRGTSRRCCPSSTAGAFPPAPPSERGGLVVIDLPVDPAGAVGPAHEGGDGGRDDHKHCENGLEPYVPVEHRRIS